jgi:RNA polymerase sigma factor (sigma-70 family)
MVEMHDRSDAQLLREYAGRGDETAFREIVTRHTDLVYSAAWRQAGSADAAADIAQRVFVDLARKARSVSDGMSAEASLAGWLYRSTRYAALGHLRDDRRRTAHERQAMEQLLTNSESAPDWEFIRPMLDEAMENLNDEDREAVLLRYFKNHDFRAVGQALGVSDDAAQKRVSRAVERLREVFAARGITVGAGGLGAAISANAIEAAPTGLAGAISTAALAGTATSTLTAAAVTKTIAMTTLQKTLVTVSLAAAVGAGVFEAHQAAQLREQNQALQQDQTVLAAQMAQVQDENSRLSNLVVQAKEGSALSREEMSELLRLRGQAAQARSDRQELAKLRGGAGRMNWPPPGLYTNPIYSNAMAMGLHAAEQSKEKGALQKLALMKDKLHLTDDQAEAIAAIMKQHIEEGTQRALNAITGNAPAGPLPTSEEDDIKALLTPDQLAAYPDYKQAETLATADNTATEEVQQLMTQMDLSPEQQEKAHAALYQIELNATSTSPTADDFARAQANGGFADLMNNQVQNQKQKLAGKLAALDGILTPDQMKTYQQQQSFMIQLESNAVQMFAPQTNNAAAQEPGN